jgi:hypothetical protein
VDSDALGASRLDVTSNVVVQNLTAIVDSGFITWSLLPVPNALPAPVVGSNMVGAGVSVAPARQFTVASFNVQRFFDTINDPESDTELTELNYANRLAKASLVVRTALHAPDVIALQEVEKLSVLRDLADTINADLGMPGEYTPYLEAATIPAASTSASWCDRACIRSASSRSARRRRSSTRMTTASTISTIVLHSSCAP